MLNINQFQCIFNLEQQQGSTKELLGLVLISVAAQEVGTRPEIFYPIRNVDEITSTSRRIDLGRICSVSDHKS